MNAHRLIRFAGQKGVQDAVVEALFEGYFCNGADIGDSQVLARIGTEGGLDRDEVLAMLAGDEGRKEVLAGDQMARNAGIQGVPSFALQGHVLFSGAVPAEEMAQTFHPRLGNPEEPRRLRGGSLSSQRRGPCSWWAPTAAPSLSSHSQPARAGRRRGRSWCRWLHRSGCCGW